MKRVILAVLLSAVARAQTPATGRVEFEIVSVKPGDPADPSSSARSTPGTLEMRNTTLNNLIRSAYRLNEFQLEGGPGWADSAKFTIEAKLPAGGPRDRIPEMLQSLLADRFKLKAHRVTKTHSVYELVVAKGGPKLERADNEPTRSSQGPRQIKGWGMPVSSLAAMLISEVGAPVIDKTGLEGKYNFILEFASFAGTPRENETLPTVFTVLQEKLGLKLEPAKGPVEILVIDSVERPSAN